MKKIISILFLLGMYLSVFGQNATIEGTVLDGSTNEPLIGVNVVVKGSANIGTATDINGYFKFKAPAKSTLILTYVGYLTKEVQATKGKMKITMTEDSKALSEVVVIGYGIQKKSVVTAAISKVSAEDLSAAKPSRIEDALKGKISGVQITQSSGQPGSDSKVRIRGIGTINNSEPLYVVDGMPVDGGINYLNPSDIASVEVLKDAASAAIYGTRGANGVILVTTKSGSQGKATISYNVSYGWQNPWTHKSVLDAKEYMVIMNEESLNDGGNAIYSADQIASAGKGTDWQKETFYKNAPIQSHQVSINGGNDKMQYYLSFGYYKQDGIVGGNYDKSNYERYSVRTNSNYTVFEAKDRNYLNKLTVGVNAAYSRVNSTGIDTNSEYGSILGSALAFSPLVSVYASEDEAASILAAHPYAVKDSHGVFSLPPDGFQEIANPVGMLNQPSSGKNNSDKFVGTFYAKLDLLPGLSFKTSYGFDLAFWGYDAYTMPYYLASQGKYLDYSTVQSEMNRGYKWQVENVLTYNKKFGEKHNLTVVLGQSAQKYTYRNLGGTDRDLLETDPLKANINSAIADEKLSTLWGGTGNYNRATLASYFGRIDYNYDERYMLQFTLRRDGSSHFGPSHKWATFPAVSVGWNVLNEPYLKNHADWFDALKVRFSWGKNGNEAIGNFTYASLMSGGQNYYFGGGYTVNTADPSKVGETGGTMQYGSSPGALANKDVKWEESEQIDLGFDASFLNNALTFSMDYYKKKTNGMLMTVQIPAYVGQSAPTGNVGKMENWGLEFELGWKSHIKDFKYGIRANASYLHNKLVKLGTASGSAIYESAGASGVGDFVKGQDGMIWPFFFGYKTNGLFQNAQEVANYVNTKGEMMQAEAKPGDVRFVDTNNDGTIDSNDRVKIGKGMPDWTYGFTITGEWKGFDLNLLFQGTIGNDIFDFSQRGDIPRMNRPSWILDRWHGEGTSNSIPRMTSANPNKNWRSSDLYIKNGNYLRLKTAQLGYTLPQKLTTKFSVQNLRLFVSAENLLTLTGYNGFDPEVASGGYTTIGIDRGVYPQSRTISIGANITF